MWHVHGSWTGSLVQGDHRYLLPVLPGGGPWGRGRSGRDWPDRAVEVPVERLRDTDVDVVVLQRVGELELVRRWLGREPGRDLPAVYVEHNTPSGNVPDSRHPLADQDDIVLVHVTHFNALIWDSGRAPWVVIEHGIADPGHRYTGELPSAGVVINDAVRRWRVTGTDLLPAFATAAPLDVFGMGDEELPARLGIEADRLSLRGDLGQEALYREIARRRVYLYTSRWTSLGLSLVEAMHLGMPVVAVASTATATAVPGDAGVVSADIGELVHGLRRLTGDRARAERMGSRAREFALRHYGLDAFLRNWDALLERAVR